MQRLLRSLGVAFVVSFLTPALLFAATNQSAPTTAAGQKATAQRQAALAEKRAIIKQMKGNSDPALRVRLIQQMKGGK